MAFTELIKNFDKVRDYMRDFYIYGFRARGDFTAKSARTYDNEKRRIESYLAPYIHWESDSKGKRVYVSLDASAIRSNPLYNAWKAKSFTDNDITLHFAILSSLSEGSKNITELTDYVSMMSGRVFESQTVRIKANEYVRQGILCKERLGKTDYYCLSPDTLSSLPVSGDTLAAAISFFQEAAPFGFIGSTILDQEGLCNEIFSFKHHYIVHTLEDGVLLELLRAIDEKKSVRIINQSTRYTKEIVCYGIPVGIFVSVQSGRRYVCLYTQRNKRFHTYRLDYIKKVELLKPAASFNTYKKELDGLKEMCWGVSFGDMLQGEILRMKLRIDEEKEGYVLERLKREGRMGTVSHIDKDTYLYTACLLDISETMAWVKSFTGRILSLEGTDQKAIDFFYRDMERMATMYGGES